MIPNRSCSNPRFVAVSSRNAAVYQVKCPSNRAYKTDVQECHSAEEVNSVPGEVPVSGASSPVYLSCRVAIHGSRVCGGTGCFFRQSCRVPGEVSVSGASPPAYPYSLSPIPNNLSLPYYYAGQFGCRVLKLEFSNPCKRTAFSPLQPNSEGQFEVQVVKLEMPCTG